MQIASKDVLFIVSKYDDLFYDKLDFVLSSLVLDVEVRCVFLTEGLRNLNEANLKKVKSLYLFGLRNIYAMDNINTDLQYEILTKVQLCHLINKHKTVINL